MRIKAIQITLPFLLGFLGLGAIAGGAVLMISPTGYLIGMPVSMLKNSPFDSFLVPGVILFTFLGLAPSLLIFALLKKPECRFAQRFNFCGDMHWSWSYCIYIAFTLIIWIQVEMVFLQAVHWLHSFYMGLALVIIYIALLPKIRNLYKTKLREI